VRLSHAVYHWTANDTEVDIGAVVGDIRVGVVAARM